MITCGTQIVSGAPVNAAGSSAPSGTGIVSVTDGVYDMPGVTTVDLAAALAGLGLSAVLAGCSSYLAFTSLADTSVFTGGLTRAVGTLTGVDNQALGVPVGTRLAVSFSGGGAQAYGGIYIVTNAGSVSTQPVITRAAEFDSSADFAALSDAGWPCGDSGLLRLSTTGGTTLDTSPVEFDVALGAVALEALIAAAIPASTLTTRGDLLRRGASAAERVALGAAGTLLRSDGTDPAWSTLTIPDTAARGTLLAASAANVVSALTLGAAGTRLTSDGTDPGWQSPDVVCTTAELATTYAPSAAMRGLIAYTTDTLSTYVCRRTAASTYAWALLAAGADAAAARAAIDAAAGATARTTTPSLASSSGWTGSAFGGGTNGAVNTGASKLDFAINANGSGSVIERTIAFALDWSVQARVVAMSDTTTNVRLVMLPFAGAGVSYPQVAVDGGGGFECKFTPASGGAVTVRALTAALTGVRAAMTAGTLWLRLRQSGGVYSYWYGIGSGTAEPTAWLLLTTYAPPGTGNGEQTPATLNIQLARTASSGAQTASVDLISYRDLTL